MTVRSIVVMISITFIHCSSYAQVRPAGDNGRNKSRDVTKDDPFCIGCNIWENMHPQPNATNATYKTTFTYKKNGVIRKFDETNYPWNDSSWKFVDSKSVVIKEATGQPLIRDFFFSGPNSEDHTEEVLTASGYTILVFIRNAYKKDGELITPDAGIESIRKIRNIAERCATLNVKFYALFSTGWAKTEYLSMNNVPVFVLDHNASKKAMPDNYGSLLLKDGVIIRKWSAQDLPTSLSIDRGELQFD